MGYGRIVMTSSPAGLYGNFGQTNYSSAKMGLVGFARAIKQEGGRKGVHANVIAPTADTRMTEGLLGSLADDSKPEHITAVVGYLCHDSCELNGENSTRSPPPCGALPRAGPVRAPLAADSLTLPASRERRPMGPKRSVGGPCPCRSI